MKEYWNMFVSKNYLEITLMNSYWFLEQVQHDHNLNHEHHASVWLRS